MKPANQKICQVTADSDPAQAWMTVEATSVYHAAIYYYGACVARGGGPPVPTPASIIMVRVDGREYRVRAGRAREWANAIAERDAERVPKCLQGESLRQYRRGVQQAREAQAQRDRVEWDVGSGY